MSSFVAALPMYDWPEVRARVDAEWASWRDRLRAAGIDAPQRLARCNADLPPVAGGIRDGAGNVIAPDPATLPPQEFDLNALWRHPDLLVAQTCWGPMQETGLSEQVALVGQPSYDGIPGGSGADYSSALLMRAGTERRVPPPDGRASLPFALLRGHRFAFNEVHSMSGYLALRSDLEAAGESMSIFAGRVETGGHRNSVRAVAEGRADVAAIDCRSWAQAQAFEPAAQHVVAVGWTARRPGLPLIAGRGLDPRILAAVKATVIG